MRDLRERIPSLVDKHIGRLHWDFVQRLDRSRRDLSSALDRSLEATIESLGAGIERSERDRKRSAEDALRAKDDVRVHRRRLEQLSEAFQGAMTGAHHRGDRAAP